MCWCIQGEREGNDMKEINIGKTLTEKRKEKEITQDEVANYMGVSKSAVSKWETGQSYPDITFLPMLAAYFNITIDELIGYEPQMTKEDIRKIYLKLATEFTTQPFEEVMKQVHEIIKKYYSCFPLLLQMGILIINHCNLEKNPDKMQILLTEIKELFYRIKVESEEIEVAKQAVFLEAYCALALGKPVETLEILGETSSLIMSSEALLASAYQMTGQKEKAKEILQSGIYQHMFLAFDLLNSYLSITTSGTKRYEEILQRLLHMAETFDIEHLHPTMLLKVYITAAQGYEQQGNHEKCIEMLQRYVELVTGDIYPIYIKGDSFFDLIAAWTKQLDLGNSMPRDEKAVRQSMIEIVVANPAFAELQETEAFKQIIKKLEASQ